jgi:serine-type D-Ala-D-Ala carboxypeptidase/endopeptidase (penicillin-binding protein 4)
MELRQRLLLGAALCVRAALCAGATAIVQEVPSDSLKALGQLVTSGASVSASVWDLDSGRVVAELRPADRLVPASLSKLVVAAAALDTWAPDKAFITQLLSAALPTAGVLKGDLILRGSGDATLDETTLWNLAAQLRNAGITQVAGNLLVERAPFGELDCSSVDRCRSLQRSSRAYNAAPSAIGVNYGSWCVAIRPTRIGQPALVRTCAAGPMPIPMDGRIVTGSTNSFQVDRTTDANGDRLSLSGTISGTDERQLHRAMSDPALGAGILLRSVLQQQGTTIQGTVVTSAALPAAATHLLAQVEGLPLQEQIGRMLRYSNNYIADVLTMGIALQTAGRAPKQLLDAAAPLGILASQSSIGARTSGMPVMTSGSGITTENRLSANDLVGLLLREYRDSRRFPVFYGSLVVPRDAPFAFLRSGGANWLDRVALKTGTLSDPVSVCGIAGYLRKKTGGWMAFAMIVNGSPAMPSVALERALGAARTDLESLLVRY